MMFLYIMYKKNTAEGNFLSETFCAYFVGIVIIHSGSPLGPMSKQKREPANGARFLREYILKRGSCVYINRMMLTYHNRNISIRLQICLRSPSRPFL